MPANIAVTVLPNGQTRVGDEPWPEEVRELAFELWYLKFHRNMPDVLDYLNRLPDQDQDHPADDLTAYARDLVVDALSARKMSISTLYAWAKRHRWAEEAERRHRMLAPALYQRVDQDLEIASISAAERLISLVTDPSTPPKIALDAANSILDRTGHTAWVRPSDDGKMQGPQRDYTGSVAGKSVEELLALALNAGSDTGE